MPLQAPQKPQFPSRRNPYTNEIDFHALSLVDSDFAKVLKSNGQIDFSDAESVVQLTRSLLRRDFDLEIELPVDRLCPPVPNRLNYILWLQDLLDTSSDDCTDIYDPDRVITGLDIGTGASCIYPLLGCRSRPNWRFFATDIDDKSLENAGRNVARNGLQDDITIVKTQAEGPLIPLETNLIGASKLDFTMCNPPFYESEEDMLSSAREKKRPPFSACTGAPHEMVVPGGEVAFINRMIDESLILRTKVQWYTSMLGKFSSLAAVVEKLQDAGCSNYAVTEFVQGNRTRRWGIAWSWGDWRPKQEFARNVGSLAKHFLPFPSEFEFSVPGVGEGEGAGIVAVGKTVNAVISELQLEWQWRNAISTGVGFSNENVWSRQARRKKMSKAESTKAEMAKMDVDPDAAALGFKIEVRQRLHQTDVDVSVRWLKGTDNVLFESFCGMLKRKVEGR